MPVIPPGSCEVTWGASPAVGYREMLTSCGFSIAAWDPADIEDIYDLWSSFISSMGAPAGFFATSVVVKVGTSDPSAPLTYEFAGIGEGTGSGQMAPPAVSLLVRKLTSLGGRRGRGRMYVPVVREDNVDRAGALAPQLVDDWDNFSPAWLDGTAALLNAGDPQPQLLHTEAPFTATSITSFQLAPQVATQRRRQQRT